jgi:hypothetical protein
MANADKQARRADREYLRELEARIVSWDPVGLIASGAHSMSTTASSIASTLDRFVVRHFGVQPSGTAAFAVEVIAWDGTQRQ